MCRRPSAAIKSSVLTSWTYLTSFMKTDSKTTTVVGSCRIWVQAGREWFESCLRSRSVAARNHYTECRQSNHGHEYVKCFMFYQQWSPTSQSFQVNVFFYKGLRQTYFTVEGNSPFSLCPQYNVFTHQLLHCHWSLSSITKKNLNQTRSSENLTWVEWVKIRHKNIYNFKSELTCFALMSCATYNAI